MTWYLRDPTTGLIIPNKYTVHHIHQKTVPVICAPVQEHVDCPRCKAEMPRSDSNNINYKGRIQKNCLLTPCTEGLVSIPFP